MNKVTEKEFYDDLHKFIQKHSKKHDWIVNTSDLISNRYHKTYTFDNGAQFIVISDMDVIENVPVESKEFNCSFIAELHLIKHEYWSTDNPNSKYWYEVNN